MAFKARTLLDTPNKPNAMRGIAQGRTVAGVELTGRYTTHAGKPPPELLDDDRVDVRDVSGDPWPDSSFDRNSAKAARRMALKAKDGTWPSERTKALEAFVERKLAEPEKVGMALLLDQGYTPTEARKILARRRMSTKGIPDVDALLADQAEKRSRGRRAG